MTADQTAVTVTALARLNDLLHKEQVRLVKHHAPWSTRLAALRATRQLVETYRMRVVFEPSIAEYVARSADPLNLYNRCGI